MNRGLLFVFAHPDDESFSGAGLAMTCRERGVRVALATATLGQQGKTGDPPVCLPEDLEACRERELRQAAEIIGFDDLHLLGYRDKELANAPPDEIDRKLVSLIRRHRPSVVVTFDPNGFNLHPDHIAISRFAMNAISAAADGRWKPDAGPAHAVTRVLWTPPKAPWEASRSADLKAEPGVDFAIDITPWRERKAAALRAHRSQHLSIDRYFFSQPDVEAILSVEIYRQAWGPPLARRPAADVFEGIAGT